MQLSSCIGLLAMANDVQGVGIVHNGFPRYEIILYYCVDESDFLDLDLHTLLLVYEVVGVV